ncbi:MAG: cell division protein FtsK [Candidatus Magasanikbacteria bacterium]|nr:cell division protein FtsK [Candidatus Magasanikbacteria bacterium]MBT4350527.1 cell division protein FtsK [Candidatus Magasanikbacteria bacterium]
MPIISMGRKKQEEYIDPPLSRGIIAVILVITAIIITLSFFNAAGTLGQIINEWILSSLFGHIRYTVPPIILILAWFQIKDNEYDYRSTHILGAILFFFSVASFFHLSFPVDDMWKQALNGNGGGFSGMLAWPLKTYVGTIGSFVILIGLLLVSIFLIFNTSVTHFILFHKKLFEKLGIVGKGITKGTNVLFVKNEDEEEYEDEDDEERFSSRNIGEEEDDKYDEEEEEDDKYDEDEEDHEEEQTQPTPVQVRQNKDNTAQDPWTKKPVIKEIPKLTLLSNKKGKPTSGDIKVNAKIIKDTFKEFRIDIVVEDVRVGPTVTQYAIKPAKGVKISKITALTNDLALALAAHPIRIEAPIPGKSLVGIEVPNEKNALVSLRELLQSENHEKRSHNLMVGLGKDVSGTSWFGDLPRMPHLLIAGATGSGKTVCMHSIIISLLYQNTAETLRMIMVDPKRVELSVYNGIPHLIAPVITNTNKTINALKWTIGEMERRFDVLAKAKCRDITSYNTKNPDTKLPHIVFFIDELADLMATAANDVEAGIIRIAQLARAVGIHLIVATQRPSVDVITGLMKANIPARIAFSVASLIDSRTILDCSGAEKLLGRGDMLHLTAELSKPVRIQGAFVTEEEVKRVVKYLKGSGPVEYDETLFGEEGKNTGKFGNTNTDQDSLFHDAKKVVIEAGKASASFLQRRLRVGYARAARIMDELEEAGIISEANGAKPRDILVTGLEESVTINTPAIVLEEDAYDEE